MPDASLFAELDIRLMLAYLDRGGIVHEERYGRLVGFDAPVV